MLEPSDGFDQIIIRQKDFDRMPVLEVVQPFEMPKEIAFVRVNSRSFSMHPTQDNYLLPISCIMPPTDTQFNYALP